MQNTCCIKYYSRFPCKTCFLNLSNGSAHRSWGISSNGRAPASHAGGTGIDARILQSSFLLIITYVVLTAAAVKVPGTEKKYFL